MKLCKKHEKKFRDMVDKACYRKDVDPDVILELNNYIDTLLNRTFKEVLTLTEDPKGLQRLAMIKMVNMSNLHAATDMFESEVTREQALTMLTSFADTAIRFVYDHEPSLNASLKA